DDEHLLEAAEGAQEEAVVVGRRGAVGEQVREIGVDAEAQRRHDRRERQGEGDGQDPAGVLHADAPASTTIAWPVIEADQSERRNCTAPATDSTRTPPGRHSPARRASMAVCGTSAVRSVGTKPGTTALTRTPRLPTSRASDRVSPRMPALEAA